MAHSVCAQRSRAEDTDRIPVIDQRSYEQPPIPTDPAPRAPATSLPSSFSVLLGDLVTGIAR